MMTDSRPPHRLELRFVETARRYWSRPAIVDTTGQKLTYGRALTASLLLARRIAERAKDDDMVGILLPASAGGALANIAALFAGKVVVNLNFTAGADIMTAAIDQCRIRLILTSRRFLEKVSIEPTGAMVFLEDLIKEIGTGEKIATMLRARFGPARRLSRGAQDPSSRSAPYGDLATVVFSSGSTGVPKGVMLSHGNLLANIDSLVQVFPLTPDDCFIGVLPFFHSFGLTGTLWLPLLVGCQVAYHPNPMDAKTVGEIAIAHRATMLISTPTFCQSYLRRCTKEQFAHLKYAIVGAEKLREPLARAFRDQYGIDLLEGYGCTEMAPVVAVNRPARAGADARRPRTKAGSVGPAIPGVEVKVVDQTTGAGPLVNRDGLLLVRGGNLMQGYLGQPERTSAVVRDGWYVTGDVARVDDDGFIFITDRLSRFSKVGGEMVPHIKVEDTINAALGETCAAVTAVPDAAKGERLFAFYAKADVPPDMLWQRLSDSDLPRLWLPRRDSLVLLDAIPTLGTGKVDLRALRDLAMARMTPSSE